LRPARRPGTELARYALTFEQSDGVNGALQLDRFEDHASFWCYLDLREAFGLRLDSRDEARTAEVGERVPVGFDLEWDAGSVPERGEGRVVGELLVGKARVPFDGRGVFEHVVGAPVPRSWADWLD
jgi:hypothetical protein